MDERNMTLARDWDYRDCTGFYWSEKFDGCRAYWDGADLWTRDGNAINAPADFLAALPQGIHLDGEVWCGRGGYIEAMTAVRHGKFTAACRFVAFDAPLHSGNWMARMKYADRFRNETVLTPERGIVGRRDEPSERAAAIISEGGEGIMLRNPFVKTYEAKRTIHLMRIKAGNLFAPWHGMRDTRPKPTGKVVGLDVRKFAFDPEIEWKLNAVFHDDAVDYSALKV